MLSERPADHTEKWGHGRSARCLTAGSSKLRDQIQSDTHLQIQVGGLILPVVLYVAAVVKIMSNSRFYI